MTSDPPGVCVSLRVTVCVLQDENDDDDDWNPCKAAGVCLMLLATCCEDDVVPHVLPFIKENIKHPDWRYRDASVMAFGSILEGPDLNQLKPLVIQVTLRPHPPPLCPLPLTPPSPAGHAHPDRAHEGPQRGGEGHHGLDRGPDLRAAAGGRHQRGLPGPPAAVPDRGPGGRAPGGLQRVLGECTF